MSNVRNVTYNPQYASLDAIAREQAGDGFGLARVVPVAAYEFVAVFTRHLHPEPEVAEAVPVEPFDVSYEVRVRVPDPRARSAWGNNVEFTTAGLHSWLSRLVEGSKPFGVDVVVTELPF